MDSTTKINDSNNQPKKPNLFRRIFGGEFFLNPEMRPWYVYISMIFVLVILLLISEQRAISKQKEIDRLEIQYREAISRLKANNRFIPYEENQMLIRKMQERGYVLDEEHTYTIAIRNTDTTSRYHFFKRIKKHDRRKK